MSYYVGIDVGGTTSTIAIGDSARRVIHVSQQFESRTYRGPQQTIQSLIQEVQSCLDRVGGSLEQVCDIGLATPGPALLEGVLLNSPNFESEDWNHFPVRAALEEQFRNYSPQASVHYIGDGQSAAFGEYAVRSGLLTWNRVPTKNESNQEKLTSLFMVIVGTGLGGGEVQQGTAMRGVQGRAGHAGHIFLPAYAFRYDHDQQLVVGNARCTVEAAVSLTGLTHQLGYRLKLDQWSDHPLNSQSGPIRDKAKQLRDLAAQGDPLALELFHDQARALGIALLSINYLGDYDLLVVGGGVCDLTSGVRDQYLRTASQAYREFALDGFKDLGRLEFSVCGDESPVIGGLAYAYSKAEPGKSV